MAVSAVVVGAPVLGGHPHGLGVGQCRLNLALLFLKRFQKSLHRVWALYTVGGLVSPSQRTTT